MRDPGGGGWHPPRALLSLRPQNESGADRARREGAGRPGGQIPPLPEGSALPAATVAAATAAAGHGPARRRRPAAPKQVGAATPSSAPAAGQPGGVRPGSEAETGARTLRRGWAAGPPCCGAPGPLPRAPRAGIAPGPPGKHAPEPVASRCRVLAARPGRPAGSPQPQCRALAADPPGSLTGVPARTASLRCRVDSARSHPSLAARVLAGSVITSSPAEATGSGRGDPGTGAPTCFASAPGCSRFSGQGARSPGQMGFSVCWGGRAG
jgi:hypothetical protein